MAFDHNYSFYLFCMDKDPEFRILSLNKEKHNCSMNNAKMVNYWLIKKMKTAQ